MRTLACVVMLLSTASLFTAAGAQAAPWCALYSTGFNDCHSFYSFEQCIASISGVGGACTRNQFETPYRTGRELRRRYRY